MNALLIYPKCPDTFWSFRHALKFISKRATQPPLGLLTVAAMLPKAWSLRLVDMNVTTLRDKDLRWADTVFISAMGIQKASVADVIARCANAGVPTVAGGPLFTANPEDYTQVDHLVLNEAEASVLGNEGFLCDGIIHLGLKRKQGKLLRFLQIEKMRTCKHSMEMHALEVFPGGLMVLGPIFDQ